MKLSAFCDVDFLSRDVYDFYTFASSLCTVWLVKIIAVKLRILTLEAGVLVITRIVLLGGGSAPLTYAMWLDKRNDGVSWWSVIAN